MIASFFLTLSIALSLIRISGETMLSVVILGALLLSVAAGLLTKKAAAGPAGFVSFAFVKIILLLAWDGKTNLMLGLVDCSLFLVAGSCLCCRGSSKASQVRGEFLSMAAMLALVQNMFLVCSDCQIPGLFLNFAHRNMKDYVVASGLDKFKVFLSPVVGGLLLVPLLSYNFSFRNADPEDSEEPAAPKEDCSAKEDPSLPSGSLMNEESSVYSEYRD